MYVRELDLEGLRSFDCARIELNVPGRRVAEGRFANVNLLLGDNGAGKTSVLRAIALAALAPVITSGSGYVPYSLVRRVKSRGPKRASIRAIVELHEQDDAAGLVDEVAVELEPTKGFVDRFVPSDRPQWSEPMWEEHSPAFLVLGYGANRRADSQAHHESVRQKSRMLRYDRVAGLFEESVTLVPLTAWLPRFRRENPGRHRQVVDLMNELLAPHAELLPEPSNDEYLFLLNGSELPFAALSDGYRGYIGWIADLLYHVCMGAPSGATLRKNQGIVLIDEVDLHLHPEWQRTVIPTLACTLPNLQFVLTSHSPLLVGSVWQENVFVLDTQEAEGVRSTTISRSPQEVFGLSADQILTSGHFGLRSTRNDRILAQLVADAQSAQDGDPEAAIRMLRTMALGGAETTAAQPDARAKRSSIKLKKPGAKKKSAATKTKPKTTTKKSAATKKRSIRKAAER